MRATLRRAIPAHPLLGLFERVHAIVRAHGLVRPARQQSTHHLFMPVLRCPNQCSTAALVNNVQRRGVRRGADEHLRDRRQRGTRGREHKWRLTVVVCDAEVRRERNDLAHRWQPPLVDSKVQRRHAEQRVTVVHVRAAQHRLLDAGVVAVPRRRQQLHVWCHVDVLERALRRGAVFAPSPA